MVADGGGKQGGGRSAQPAPVLLRGAEQGWGLRGSSRVGGECGAGRENGSPSARRGREGSPRGPSAPKRPGGLRTSVVMVPAPRVVVVQDLGGGPGIQDVVHLVLLPPGQRLAHDLPGFVDVEVPGT